MTDPLGLLDDLDGFCAVASFGLWRRLREHRIPAALVGGTYDGFGHWWVTAYTPTGRVLLDVTATQFGEGHPPVVLLSEQDVYEQDATPWRIECGAYDLRAGRKMLSERIGPGCVWTPAELERLGWWRPSFDAAARAERDAMVRLFETVMGEMKVPDLALVTRKVPQVARCVQNVGA